MKYKAEGDSRIQEERKISERKRNILVLIQKHLISCGYCEAAQAMSRECNIGLDKWDVADNIDFYTIVQDFEDFYEMKFMKKPVLVRKSMAGMS